MYCFFINEFFNDYRGDIALLLKNFNSDFCFIQRRSQGGGQHLPPDQWNPVFFLGPNGCWGPPPEMKKFMYRAWLYHIVPKYTIVY